MLVIVKMRVNTLHRNPSTYSGNAYLIRGDNNAITDVNTMIDSGSDGFMLSEIETIYTGVGKKGVELVLLTHHHFDHAGGLKFLKKRYDPVVCGFSPGEYVTHILKDDETLKVGDSELQVIHTPGHSNDSVCYYNYENKILFSGDCPIHIISEDSTFTDAFLKAYERLAFLHIDIIYPGHGSPITENVPKMMKDSLDLIYRSVRRR